MKKNRMYLAIDLGASSGRVMAGLESPQDGNFELLELHRFSNGPVTVDGRLLWDYDRLWREIKTGMKKAGGFSAEVVSVGVCSWGVDYVLLDEDGAPAAPFRAYRDERFRVREVEADLYGITGILPQSINTIFQLMAEDPAELQGASSLLFTADYFHYLLSGVQTTELSLASTSGLVNVRTGAWAEEVMEAAGIPRHLFGKIAEAGQAIGDLRPELAEEFGYTCRVVLPCSHDTASAYFAVPSDPAVPSAILSSGTWSLLGAEPAEPVTTEAARAAGFTNEKGYGGRTLMLQNLSGMWLIQELRRQEAPDKSWDVLAEEAASEDDFAGRIDPADERFLAPASMAEEIRSACAAADRPVPETLAQVLSTVYHSLAETYAAKIKALGELTGQRFERLHMVGGGSKDAYLKALTRQASGLEILSGPTEGSALGNILIQKIGVGHCADEEAAKAFLKKYLH